jgi:uncharacterized membrane protein YhaH (DUF805 family)
LSYVNEENSSSSNHQLKLLKSLYDEGILTKDEYIQKRDKIIDDLMDIPNDDQVKRDESTDYAIDVMESKTEIANRKNSNLFFGVHGRLSRGWYFLYNHVVNFSVVLFVLLFIYLGIITSELIVDLSALLIFANNIMQKIKRLHDLGRPGAHVLLMLVPFYSLYLALLLLLLRGEETTNQYGEIPHKQSGNQKNQTIN